MIHDSFGKSAEGKVHVISLNPDLTDSLGHPLAYDIKLNSVCTQRGVGFITAGNAHLESGLLESHPYFRATFSNRSSATGVVNGGIEPDALRMQRFRSEVEGFVDQYLGACEPGDKLILYLYTGGLPHVEVLYDVVKARPQVSGHIVLFWLGYRPIHTEILQKRWAKTLRRAPSESRLVLTVLTREMQSEIQKAVGVIFPIEPAPSTTFDDIEARNALEQSELHMIDKTKSANLSVVFPGLMREAKGYDLSISVIRMLHQRQTATRYQCTLRYIPRKDTPSELIKIAQEARPFANIVEGILPPKEFQRMIKGADIVVLPYQPSEFGNRPSGILIDTLFCGIPVVVQKGTWLGNLLARYNCGALAETAHPEAYVKAIESVATNYCLYRKNAINAGKKWLEDNSWATLLDCILEPRLSFDISQGAVPMEPNKLDELKKDIGESKTALTEPESDELEKRTRWMKIKDLYRGQRAFIIGNGPSLNRTPLHLLNDEFTLCFNRFDLMFDRLGWLPTMYMCIDNRVAENTSSQINEIVPLVRFAFFPDIHPRGGDFRQFIKDSSNIFWLSLESVCSSGSYETLPTCSTIGTVAHLGLQVIAFMGFSPIYLVGIDLDYKEHKTVVKHTRGDWTAVKDDDPSHFDPRYFGAGAKYHEPSPHKVLVSGFESSKELLDRKNIRVMNAGIGGLVETFPRVDFRSLFNYEEDVELEMLLDAIHPALRRDAREALKGNKVITIHDDWDEKRPFTVTSAHLGEQLISEVIFTHIPYGPFRDRYLFIRREKVPSAIEATTVEAKRNVKWLDMGKKQQSYPLSESNPILNKSQGNNGSRSPLFLVGNGPSLRNMDFHKLQSMEWIGMNAAYRFWEKIHIYPAYYICMDTIVIESHKEKIYELIQKRMINGIKLFFIRKTLLKFYPDLANIAEVIFFEDYYKNPYFEGITQYTTTGSFAALIGGMLGYRRLYLLGIDLNYIQLIPEARKVEGYVLEISETPKNNPNYFFDDYQRKGDKYNVPDSSMPDLHYHSWVKVKERLEYFGIDVLNCNQNSQVDIFDYANADEILTL